MDAKLRIRGETLLFEPRAKPWRTTRDAIGDLPDPEVGVRKLNDIPNHRFQPGARSYRGSDSDRYLGCSVFGGDFR